MKFIPHDYQQYAIEYIETHEVAAVLLVMGLGKTAITLTALYDLLFDYFVDKIFVGVDTLTIASWFFDRGAEIRFEDLAEAQQAGEVLNVEFDTSPRGGPP